MVLQNLMGPYGLHIRQMFYMVTPWETMYGPDEVLPHFVGDSTPWFVILIAWEVMYCWKKDRKGAYGLHDSMTSLSAAMFHNAMFVMFKGAEMSMYWWVHEHYRLCTLPWDSIWTWLTAFIAADFIHYVGHRAAHEVNILWALHQTHHSSEYYNMTTALRQGMLHHYFGALFFLVPALFIPYHVFLVHVVLNFLYQFWLHTEQVASMGPLERIINTPANHRVHHGRNRLYIDKNYGGTLMIWDHLFGTYQSEVPSEPVLYGLTEQVGSFDPLYVQLFYFKNGVWDKARAMRSMGDKMRALFYGPGWTPEGAPGGAQKDARPRPKHDTGVHRLVSLYVLVHGGLLLLGFQVVFMRIFNSTWPIRLMCGVGVILSVQTLGLLLERRPYAPVMEIGRCLATCFCWCGSVGQNGDLGRWILQVILLGSSMCWVVQSGYRMFRKIWKANLEQ